MLILFFALLGLLIGSLVNAVVWRLHEQSSARKSKSGKSDKLSIVSGRSMCPKCRHQLAAIDLIPVLSWLSLRGRCRYCRTPISVQYPMVELAMAVLYALLGFSLTQVPLSLVAWFEIAFWLYFLAVLAILAVYDWKWYILPDAVLLPAIVVGMIRLGALVALGYPLEFAVWALLAALVAGGSFYALVAVSRGKWMGGGDIKLVFLMGLILGGAKLVVALMIAFNAGAIVGLLLIALKRKNRNDHIPFGPFLVGGTIIALLYGQVIVDWYVKLNGF
jgi:leader peptidase (prepilin peptidase) / N-methyltransferase